MITTLLPSTPRTIMMDLLKVHLIKLKIVTALALRLGWEVLTYWTQALQDSVFPVMRMIMAFQENMR